MVYIKELTYVELVMENYVMVYQYDFILKKMFMMNE